MNPMGLLELAQIREQEHMREALRRAAARQARRDAGITWWQAFRSRLMPARRTGSSVAPVASPLPATEPVRSLPAPPPPMPSQPLPSGAHLSQPAPRLRVVHVAEAEPVTADC